MAGMGNLAFAGQGYIDAMSKLENMAYLKAIRQQIIQESIRKQQADALDRQAMGAAMGGIMTDPTGGMAQMPGMPQMGPTPGVGQASVPMASPMGGYPSGSITGPAPADVGGMSYPPGSIAGPAPADMPGAAPPMPNQPIAGRLWAGNRMPTPGAVLPPSGGGGGLPVEAPMAPPPSAPAPRTPSLYGGQGSPLGAGGAFDMRGLAQRIKRANPGLSDEGLFRAVVKAQALLNPAGKAELQIMMQAFKQDALEQRLQAMSDRVTAQQEGAMARVKAQQEGAQGRVETQTGAAQKRAETVQGAVTDRSKATQEAITSRVQGTNEAAQTRAETQQAGAMARTEANIQGRKDVAAAKTDAKAAQAAQSFESIADEADALAAAVKKDPGLVGLKGKGREIVGSVKEQLGVGAADKGRADFQTRMAALQQRLRGEVMNSKHFSAGAQGVVNSILPGLGRLDNPTLAVTGLTNLSQRLRAEAKTARTAPAADAGGADQAAPAGAARPRAKNPKTGEVVEWDGTAWVPTQ